MSNHLLRAIPKMSLFQKFVRLGGQILPTRKDSKFEEGVLTPQEVLRLSCRQETRSCLILV